ncbi:MAG: hypothetical protein M3O20_01995 [Acidobacteriota bacterium]|nr:hypothetical protein [Acidobacteriota bacterium]
MPHYAHPNMDQAVICIVLANDEIIWLIILHVLIDVVNYRPFWQIVT